MCQHKETPANEPVFVDYTLPRFRQFDGTPTNKAAPSHKNMKMRTIHSVANVQSSSATDPCPVQAQQAAQLVVAERAAKTEKEIRVRQLVVCIFEVTVFTVRICTCGSTRFRCPLALRTACLALRS